MSYVSPGPQLQVGRAIDEHANDLTSERAVGRTFSRWLDAFYDLVEGDELLAPLFDAEGHVPSTAMHVTTSVVRGHGWPAR